ncbi:MAG: hypothetical protein Q4A21_01155 [bacterium]|nr:hypothetical protein [bacterium]
MALLTISQFEERFNDLLNSHPELNEKQVKLLRAYLEGSNHFERIITSANSFRVNKVPRWLFNGGESCAFKDVAEPR